MKVLLKVFKVSKSLAILFCLNIASENTFADNQVFSMSETHRIEASISQEMMNRVAVSNDRIVNVFGDEGTFVVQTDEQTGQVFIKPTAENNDKPLSLTVITENGLTQDLLLKPNPGAATTIVLKNRLNAQQKSDHTDSHVSFINASASGTLQEQFIQIMKQVILGELSPVEKKQQLSRTGPSGYRFSFIKTYQAGSYSVTVWSIKNGTKSHELDEKLFYKPGDLALCLESRQVEPGDKTLLYALQRL